MAETRKQFLASVRRALQTPICFPFVDDGPIARRTIDEFRSLDWDHRPSEDEVRVTLCEARYRDWQRARFTVIEGGKS